MKASKRRNLDRRYNRRAAEDRVKEYLREQHWELKKPPINTRELPHPKRSVGTAYDYITWLTDNGYGGHAVNFLRTLYE